MNVSEDRPAENHRACDDEIGRLRRTIGELEAELAEEKRIVSQIWEIYGNPLYETLNGKSIMDLVKADHDGLAAAQAEVKRLKDELADLRASLGATNATDMTCRGGKEATT